MTATIIQPLGIATLHAGSSACWACGLPVEGEPTHPFRIVARLVGGDRIEEFTTPVQQSFGECERCAARKQRAADIVESIPELRRLGQTHITAERFTHALVTLDALETAEPQNWTAALVYAALERLEAPGKALTWSSRWSPVRGADARADTCASEPFLYADHDAARRGLSQWFIDQLPPIPRPHPTGGGCALCGVSASLGRRPSESWTDVRGKLYCAVCAPIAEEGVTVKTMIDMALLDVIDPNRTLRRKRPYAPHFKGVRAGFESGVAPSATPWSWVGLDAVRASLEAGEW